MAIGLNFGGAGSLIVKFLRWWRRELAACVPQVLHAGLPRTDRTPVLALSGNTLYPAMSKAGVALQQIDLGDEGFSARIERFFEGRGGLFRRANRIRLTLPREDCLVRRLEVPVQARERLGDILKLDIERATPFKQDEIYHAHIVLPDGEDRSKLTLEHLVVKRSRVDDVVERLQTSGRNVTAVSVFDADPQRELPVDFLAAGAPEGRGAFLRSLNKLLVLGVLGLGVALVMLNTDRQTAALAELDGRIADAKTRALDVRRRFDEARLATARATAASQRKIEAVTFTQVWQELTRIIPDTAWLADLRVKGHQIQINGYAATSADLLQLLESSPLFAEASFVAPVTMDTRLKRERFSISLKLVSDTGES